MFVICTVIVQNALGPSTTVLNIKVGYTHVVNDEYCLLEEGIAYFYSRLKRGECTFRLFTWNL